MDQVAQIREKIDIVSLISEYIPLKKMGRNFTTVCPFHNEKSPSFVVSPERQIWHCFGCGKGGDAFTFLMEYESLEFVEALRILGKKAGVEIKKLENYQGASQKEKIYRLNNLAAEYYHYILTKHTAGKEALDYLKNERGLSDKLIDTYNLGFAPGGESLSKYLILKKKFPKGDLYEAGLIAGSGNRVFDFFRNRIVFPLADQRGNIVGFSARVYGKSQEQPKYLNSRETFVYHKGSMFFGLDKAWESIKKYENAIIMEGELDVISSFKEGIDNAVAIKGTALTTEQALLISRFTPKITLCLDQDEAGFMATKRSLPVLEERGLLVTVARLSGGKDPDSAIKENSDQFKKDLKEDIPVYDFILERLISENDKQNPIGKKKITDEMLPLIGNISNEVVKEHYLKKLGDSINTSIESLQKEIDKKVKTKKEDNKIIQRDKRERREILEEYLLGLLVQSRKPKFLVIKVEELLEGYKFLNSSYGFIFKAMVEYLNINETLEDKKFLSKLDSGQIKIYDTLFILPIPSFEEEDSYEKELERTGIELKVMFLKERIREIGRKLKEEKISSSEEEEKLKHEFNKMTTLLASASAPFS
jgi:DNA primase